MVPDDVLDDEDEDELDVVPDELLLDDELELLELAPPVPPVLVDPPPPLPVSLDALQALAAIAEPRIMIPKKACCFMLLPYPTVVREGMAVRSGRAYMPATLDRLPRVAIRCPDNREWTG